MSTCNCTNPYKNFGVSSCPFKIDVLHRMIFVPLFDTSGTENEFANVAAVTKAALQAKFDNVTKANRFFASPFLDNVVPATGDDINVDLNIQRVYKLRDGKVSYTAIITPKYGAHPDLLSRLRSLECGQWGYYGIDELGNFEYITDESTKLKVKPIQLSHISVKEMKASNDMPYHIMLSFDISTNMDAGLIRIIAKSSLDFDGNSDVDVYALRDVDVAYTSITTTGCRAYFFVPEYNEGVEGLLVADISLTEISPAAGPGALSSLTPVSGSPGYYDIVWVAEAPSDKLRITTTKSRYDFTLANAEDIDIP